MENKVLVSLIDMFHMFLVVLQEYTIWTSLGVGAPYSWIDVVKSANNSILAIQTRRM